MEPSKQDRLWAADVAERFKRAVETHKFLARTGAKSQPPDLAEFLAQEAAKLRPESKKV